MIEELAHDSRPPFRNTGAWVIGRTCDPRFTLTLGKLMTDADELVRSQAFRSMRAMKDSLKCSGDKERLYITPLRRSAEAALHCLSIAVFDASGQRVRQVPGTRFLLRVDGDYIRKYKVEECDSPDSLNIGFVLSLPKLGEEEAARTLQVAVELCMPTRRMSDRWAILKLPQNACWARFGQPSEHAITLEKNGGALYTGIRTQIDVMLQQRPVYLNGQADHDALHGTVRDMLTTEFGTGNPELILCGETPDETLMAALLRRRAGVRFRVHAAVMSGEVPGNLAELIDTTAACSSAPHRTGWARRFWRSIRTCCTATNFAGSGRAAR